jgi:hypothetical protein
VSRAGRPAAADATPARPGLPGPGPLPAADVRAATSRVLSSAASVGPVPAQGALEELDGTPIRPPATVARRGRARPAAGWWRAASLAASLTWRRPALWPFALVAFLARGGILVLAFPIVVLPTLIGISNLVGPASVTAGGPAPRLVALLAVGIAAGALAVIVGTALAAAAETAFLRVTVAPAPDGRRQPILFGACLAPAGQGRGASRVFGLRLVLLAPVAAAVAVALPSWVEVAYRELTLPTDLAMPLALRVLAGAPAATGLLTVTWLVAEVVGGFAARRAVLFDTGLTRALGRGLVDPLRAPLGTLLTTTAGLAVAIATLVPATWALSWAWELARAPLVDEGLSPAAAGGTVVLAAAWIAALALAAIGSAWRGCLATAEILRRPGPSIAVPDGAALTAGQPAIDAA